MPQPIIVKQSRVWRLKPLMFDALYFQYFVQYMTLRELFSDFQCQLEV